jgi:hypothetical protein
VTTINKRDTTSVICSMKLQRSNFAGVDTIYRHTNDVIRSNLSTKFRIAFMKMTPGIVKITIKKKEVIFA